MRTRRLAAGLYEIDTDSGTFDVERIDGEWFIVWPDSGKPDAVTGTLRDAKRIIANNS